MSFSTAIRTCLRKCADFGGRAQPAELWWFVLLVVVGFVATRTIDAVLGTEKGGDGALASATLLLVLLPLLAAGARRLHDAGLSAWWLLIVLVPCGNVALLFFLLRDSQGDNRYGASPFRPAAAA